MTEQEAIKLIKNIIYMLNDDLLKALCKAIISLEKQIPKKPIHCYSGCVEMWKCPNCSKDIMRKQYQTMTDGRKDNFCQNCGQKIDWGNEDDRAD